MSNIYEALKRAEQERAKLGRGGSSQQDMGQISPVPSHVHSFETYVEPEMDGSLLHPVSAAWQPSVERLPALQLRGNHVEGFRSLRSKLSTLRHTGNQALKSLIVSSGLPEEGKSFVAANLAISLARHRSNRVLLIDGDLRRGTLHKLLGTRQGPGLAEYLAGKNTAEEVAQRESEGISDSEQLPGLASLVFIPCGDAGDKAADLSGSPRFGKLIEQMSGQFDWIIVDSSPVNLVSDGVNFARSCDGVLLVARAGITKFETAQRAVRELKSSHVVGTVLNAIDYTKNDEGYYGY